MDSRFEKENDPIRNPLVQQRVESIFKSNYKKSLDVIKAQTSKILLEKSRTI